MYDSVSPGKIPANAQMVAGYVDGKYKWSQDDWNRFPHAVHVTITALGGNTKADVVDCEAGDTTPASAAAWVRARKAEGYNRPTIYCSLSAVKDVRKATGNLLLNKDYDIWIADYDNSPRGVYGGTAAKQYKNTASYDVSAVYDDKWPHRSITVAKPPAPKPVSNPAPKPTPQPKGTSDMVVLSTKLDGKTVTTYTYNGTDVRHIVSVEDNNAVVARLGEPIEVTPEQLKMFNGGALPEL
jgi:hypothetical protein